MITKLINVRTERYLQFKRFILNGNVKWSWLNETTPDSYKDGYDNFGFYVHPFVDRPDKLNGYQSCPSSDYTSTARDVILELLKNL